MHSELFHAVSYVYISLLEQPFVFPAVNNYFTFLLARFISIHITTTASPNSNRKSLVIFQCIRQSMIFIPVPFLRNTLSRSPHLPSPFRIGCFLDVYFCSHPWNAFPTFLLETWFWDSLSFFIVPHQKKKKKRISILVASGKRVYAMKMVLHIFLLPMYHNLEESFSLKVAKVFPYYL